MRLVYADWLDENGDPDRAEHIRLTVKCQRDTHTNHLPDPRWLRANEILKAHREEWTAELPGPAILWSEMFAWGAGFPECVAVIGSEMLFLPHAEEIVARTPARSIILAVLNDAVGTLTALAACPQMVHFREIYTARTRVGDVGAEIIANSPNFAGMRELFLSNNNITDLSALALARSPHLTDVRALRLEQHTFSPAVRESLKARYGERVFLNPLA